MLCSAALEKWYDERRFKISSFYTAINNERVGDLDSALRCVLPRLCKL